MDSADARARQWAETRTASSRPKWKVQRKWKRQERKRPRDNEPARIADEGIRAGYGRGSPRGQGCVARQRRNRNQSSRFEIARPLRHRRFQPFALGICVATPAAIPVAFRQEASDSLYRRAV